MVISFACDYAGGEIKLDDDMQNWAWVTYEESKKYQLIDGIVEEFYMIERRHSGERDVEWERAENL